MNKSFTKADLENIDFQVTYKDDEGFLYIDDILGGFKITLKDGRRFYCRQDLDHVFTIYSKKYGDIKGNLFAKIAADLIADNDKFVAMIYGASIVANFVLENYVSRYEQAPESNQVLQDTYITIIKEYARSNAGLAIMLLKMGLDENNKFVAIESIDE